MHMLYLNTTVSHGAQESLTFSSNVSPFPVEQMYYDTFAICATWVIVVCSGNSWNMKNHKAVFGVTVNNYEILECGLSYINYA